MGILAARTIHYEEARAFCPTCGRPETLVRRRINHLRHFLFSVLTLGLWVVGWFFVVYAYGHWRCGKCGSPVEPERHHVGGRLTWVVGAMSLTALLASATGVMGA